MIDVLPFLMLISPETFYIDKNNHLYFVFQQYAIAPYAAGFIVIDIGEVPEK